MNENEVVINVNQSNKLGPMVRLVWQELFNIYRDGGGDLSKMDNLLCDLKKLKNHIKENNELDLWWGFNTDGWTNTTHYRGYLRMPYHIKWSKQFDRITITKEE